jgi:hypothetical protein
MCQRMTGRQVVRKRAETGRRACGARARSGIAFGLSADLDPAPIRASTAVEYSAIAVRSLRLGAGEFNHFRPLLSMVGDEFLKVGR